ncbi:MAG TPA: methyltransferase domain-containing protein [Mycobacteriales bacterium]|nr:methyltransferase domain-containing protein [Mycobacteriales bacterium]
MGSEGAERRHHHAGRTAATQAAFLLPYLRPGMTLLDLGCGPGSITVGLRDAVAPGLAVGLDARPQLREAVPVVGGDVTRLPFAAASFDAIYASAVLQHLRDPLVALREARRVARPGAVIGVVDADWDGELCHPTDPLQRRSVQVLAALRAGTSPYVGRQLRQLLLEAGFSRAEGSARAVHYGTSALVREIGTMTAGLLRDPGTVRRAVTAGLATAAELADMSAAWTAWSTHPGAFLTRFWCEAIAWSE